MSFPRRAAALLAGCAGLALLAGCEWLFGTDDAAPSCVLTSPGDSAIVVGTAVFQAEASDSFGVDRVEFYVDGSLFGVDSEPSYSVYWDTEGLEERSWHQLSCVAFDPSGNAGYSDTVSVEVRRGGQRDILHGRFELPAGYYRWEKFGAEQGDLVSGDCRIASGGVLSRFIILDVDNYTEFQAGRSYTAVHETTNAAEFSVQALIPADGDFYLIFLNQGSDVVNVWARFVLE